MKIEVRSFQAPRWLLPLLVLAALALIPFALMLAVGVAALALGAGVLRLLLSSKAGPENTIPFDHRRSVEKFTDGPAIDADFEVKDENEKDQLH